MHARACTRPRARAHTLACARKYITFIAFSRQQLLAKAPQCYVIRTLSVFYTSYEDIQHVSATEESQNVFHIGTTGGKRG